LDAKSASRDFLLRKPATNSLLHKFYFFSIVELMTERSYLGEFELMILLAVIHLGDEAYGVPISRELEKNRGREVSVGSVYAALERLETKGLVSSSLGDPTPERGGKAKRFFRVTQAGLRQMHDTRRVLVKLWKKLPELKGERI
jgi:PadR family transcriptional regulator PadR